MHASRVVAPGADVVLKVMPTGAAIDTSHSMSLYVDGCAGQARKLGVQVGATEDDEAGGVP